MPTEFSRAFELAARAADRPASEIRTFIEHFVDVAQKIPDVLAQKSQRPIVIDLKLTLTADSELLEECVEEMKQAYQA